MLVSDAAEELLAEAVPNMIASHERRVFRACDELVWRITRRNLPGPRPLAQGQHACELVSRSIAALNERIHGVVRRRSSTQWLWMLRRLPSSVFEGELATTAGYDETLAESATGAALEIDEASFASDYVVSFPMDRGALDDLLTLCSLVRFASDLHRAYRWAAKGAPLLFNPHGRPAEIADAELRASVALYDQRVVGSARAMSRQGSALAEGPDVAGAPGTFLRVMPIRTDSIRVPGRFLGALANEIPGLGRAGAKIKARFTLQRVAAPRFLSLNPALAPKELAVVFLLHTAALYIHRHRAGAFSILTRGYLLIETAMLRDLFSQHLDYVSEDLKTRLSAAGIRSVDDLWPMLRRVRGTTWPLVPGPVIREGDGWTCLDLASASKHLDVLEADSTQGEVANARGEDFEQTVQAAIDRSAWRPDDAFRAIRRRPLKVKGRTITDLDAVGVFGSTLLAVSCKSTVYRKAYDQGDHVAVRNLASLTKEAVGAWNQKIDSLKRHSVGDNYDLSRFADVIGVVCLPTVPWVPLGAATNEVAAGLRAACSYAELTAWLRGSAEG